MSQDRSNVVVRLASDEDKARISEVFDAAFAPLRSVYRPKGEAIARQKKRAAEGTRLVAELDGRVVGTVQLADHRRHVHIIGLAVDPAYQRLGVARRMVQYIVQRAPSLGHSIVALDTIKETGNVELFEKLGFRVVGQRIAAWCESDRYDELHDVQMERDVE